MRKRGLGDVLKSIFTKLGFNHCSKCEERKRSLNNRFTIGKD